MTSPTIVDQLIELERDIRYRHPPDDGQLPFESAEGSLPVLLSAPHGAAHRRDDYYKEEDEYTAAIVRLLGARTNAHVLYTWALSDSDPNWDRQSPYKNALRHMVADRGVRFVIDLHGMSDRHKFGVAVGTMHGRSCPREESLILDTLQQQGFRPSTARAVREHDGHQWDRYVLNHRRFTGGITSHTVTRYAREELRIASVQIELCASLRIARRRSRNKRPSNFAADPAAITHTVETMELLIRKLAKSVATEE